MFAFAFFSPEALGLTLCYTCAPLLSLSGVVKRIKSPVFFQYLT
jgi:hypothetical protein